MKLHARIALALAAFAFAAPARATEFAAGDGSPDSPYVIRNAAQLAKFRDIVNGANGETKNSAACARLAADIDLGGAAWTPIGKFTGTFDGQGHTIGGLSVNLQSSGVENVYAGLFGLLNENATVKDLGVRGDVAARGSGDYAACYAGGIAAYNIKGTVEGCFHDGSVSADSIKESHAGGIVGWNEGTVRNCRHAGPVASTESETVYAGGVVGNNHPGSTMRNCYAVGAVTATGGFDKHVGGVAGYNHRGTLENCYYDTTVAGAIVAVDGEDTGGATGKTTAEMQGLDALSRLDLNAGLDAEAWMATEGYPELKAFVAYPLWIGGVRFTAGNLVIDADDDPGITSGTATYDPASNTLWLTNFVYSGPGLLTNRYHCALYYEAHSPDFVIDVSGTNRLAQSGADEGGYSFGLSGQGASTVTIRSADGGRLSVAADAASYSYGIYAHYVDLVIDGAAVYAVGGPGLYHSFGAMFDLCSLTIESGSLAAQGGKATNYNSVGVSLGSTRESLFVKGGSLIATGGEGGWGSYGILGWGSSNPTPLSFTGGETLAQGGTAGIADASLSVADGLAVFAGADADGAAAVEGDGWKDQKCVRIAPPPVAATVTFNNGNGPVAYDGQGHGVDVAVSDPADGAALRFTLDDPSDPDTVWSESAPMFTNVCDETVWVELSAEGYRTATISAAVTIARAPLAITAKDQTYVYNGRPQGEGDPVYVDPADIAAKVDVAGLVAGDTLASIVLSGHQTDPGVYTNWIAPSDALVTNTMGDATANYDIGYTNGTLTIEEPPPPTVSNVRARQRWPWNGLVDVDYEVGGYITGLVARISFEERGGAGRTWVATNFLADAEPSAEPGEHRATWDARADGAADVLAAEVVATVSLVSIATDPIIIPDPDVWLLPPGYDLIDGVIYNSGQPLRSADYIDTDRIIAPGDSCTCLLISSYEDANGDTRYRQIDATPSVSVESDEKDMFSTTAEPGKVTVTLNQNTLIGSSAAISCSVAGYQMKNSLTFATASMRGIRLYLPESGRPQRYDENAWDVYARVVPFADNSREVEAGATYQKATLSNDKLDELLVRDFSYIQNGNTFVQNMYKLEASVPDPAAKVLVLFELRAKNAADGDWGFVMPAYMIDLSKSLYEEDRNYTENDYVPYDADYFFPLWTAEFNTNQTPFGTYKGNAKTKAFKVGDGVGFHTGRMTGSEGAGQGLWTINVSHVRPLDAAVIEGSLDDGNMKAAGKGETCLLGSWYGVEGIVYPIHFTELSTNPSTFSAEPTLLRVTE